MYSQDTFIESKWGVNMNPAVCILSSDKMKQKAFSFFHHSLQFYFEKQANKHTKLCSRSFHPHALQGTALRHFLFSRSNSRDFPFIFCLPFSSFSSNIANLIQPLFTWNTGKLKEKRFSCLKRGWLGVFAVMADQSAQLENQSCARWGHLFESSCTLKQSDKIL